MKIEEFKKLKTLKEPIKTIDNCSVFYVNGLDPSCINVAKLIDGQYLGVYKNRKIYFYRQENKVLKYIGNKNYQYENKTLRFLIEQPSPSDNAIKLLLNAIASYIKHETQVFPIQDKATLKELVGLCKTRNIHAEFLFDKRTLTAQKIIDGIIEGDVFVQEENIPSESLLDLLDNYIKEYQTFVK